MMSARKAAHEKDVADIIVIGAGVAGLTAARNLAAAGMQVQVLEKSRGLGGRAATRRLHGYSIDHGAQYFTVRDERFGAQVKAWQVAGRVRVWSEGFPTLREGRLEPPKKGHPRYIFEDGMSGIGKALGEGLDIMRSSPVVALSREDDAWQLTLEDSSKVWAARVLVSVPTPQALELTGHVLNDATRKALAAVTFAPCLALMAGYAEKLPSWRGVQIAGDGPLSWIACDSSKRPECAETVLVLHGSPAFSGRWLETPDKAAPDMLGVAETLGFAAPRWTTLHRWRYAKVTRPHDEPSIRADETLFFCGDWCGGDKLEAAYLSGLEVAKAVQVA